MGKVSFGGSMRVPQSEVDPHNPAIVLWGNGQTSRLQEEASGADRAQDSESGTKIMVFLRWQIGEKFFGATDDMLQFITASDWSNYTPNTRPSVARGDIGFNLTPGYWSFYGDMKLRSNYGGQQSRIWRITDGLGDDLLAESIPGAYSGAKEGLDPNTGRLKPLIKTPPIKIAATDVVYVIDGDRRNSSSNRSQFLELEFYGP